MLSAIVSVSGLSLTDVEKTLLERYNPLGVTLFARNIDNKEQLTKLVSSIKDVIGREDVLIAVDQEGGRVRRLRDPEFNPVASQYILGQLDRVATKYHAQIISQDFQGVGINMNFAPVLDILYPATHPVLKSRCFSDDENIVANLG